MPFFNCSTSLFAYIICFGGEKIRKKKFLDGVTAHHISVLSGGGVGMLLIMLIYLKISKNIVYLLYIICII